jgi:AcrR family transcriptional regulator
MSIILSRERYFETALEVLADVGFTGLNIGVMCMRLGVTSGSFYHHFGSWRGFIDALLGYWEHRQERILRDLAFGQADPEQDIEALRKLTVDLPHKAESAIRSWGMKEASVREAQRRVDNARRKTVARAIERVIGDAAATDVVTSLGMAMLVGYQQLSAGGDEVDLEQILDKYLKTFVYTRST